MATRFQSTTVSFDSPGTLSFSIDFQNTVRDAGACIQGYDISFGSSDHHLRDLQVSVQNVKWNNTIVSGDILFDMRDGSSNKGKGTVTVGASADVEA